MILAHALALSTGGVPLLYLGDEVAQLNDYSYRRNRAEAGDSRWVHRPHRPEQNYADRTDATTPAGRVFSRLTRLIDVRRSTPELAGNELIAFDAHVDSVVAFLRPGDAGTAVLVLANVADHAVEIDALTLSGLEPDAIDLLADRPIPLAGGLTVPAHGVLWLRVGLR